MAIAGKRVQKDENGSIFDRKMNSLRKKMNTHQEIERRKFLLDEQTLIDI